MICGHCQKVYELVDGYTGHPDLEGIFMMQSDGQKIRGIDIDICSECVFNALMGQKGWRRRKNICYGFFGKKRDKTIGGLIFIDSPMHIDNFAGKSTEDQ